MKKKVIEEECVQTLGKRNIEEGDELGFNTPKKKQKIETGEEFINLGGEDDSTHNDTEDDSTQDYSKEQSRAPEKSLSNSATQGSSERTPEKSIDNSTTRSRELIDQEFYCNRMIEKGEEAEFEKIWNEDDQLSCSGFWDKNHQHFFNACYEGDIKTLQTLVNRININESGPQGDVPLHIAACQLNRLDMVKFLLENGANINVQDSKGTTVLHMACKSKNLDMVKFLLENGANINAQNTHGTTVLHMACKSKNLDMVKFLLENGANIDIKDVIGKTALECFNVQNLLKQNLLNSLSFIEKEAMPYLTSLYKLKESGLDLPKSIVVEILNKVKISKLLDICMKSGMDQSSANELVSKIDLRSFNVPYKSKGDDKSLKDLSTQSDNNPDNDIDERLLAHETFEDESPDSNIEHLLAHETFDLEVSGFAEDIFNLF